MSESRRLEGKTALITGGSSGIGQAMSDLFASHGAKVAAVSRNSLTRDGLPESQVIVPIQADITKAEDVERMFDEAEAHFGGIDIICNVAGINDLGYPLDEMSDERWNQVLDLDLRAPFQICRRGVRGMLARGTGGAILNIGSYAALRGNHGPAYSAAKHGLTGLSLSIAVAYAKRNIRCNVINPGAVRTSIGANSGGEYHSEGYKMFRGIVDGLPVNWICDPEEIARASLFLCSDDARHINGAVLAVDGGMAAC